MESQSSEKFWSWSSFFLGLLVAGLCIFVAREASKEVVSFNPLPFDGRSPASIQHNFDFSHLEGENLEKAAKKRLLESIHIERTAGFSTIRLGNFVQLNQQNKKEFACGIYDHIMFTFQAEGVASEGEHPQLILNTPCQIAKNINELEPVQIPLQKILAQSPTETVMASGSLELKTQNVSESWPRKWILTSLTLSRSGSALHVLHISPDEMRDLTNKTLSMNW